MKDIRRGAWLIAVAVWLMVGAAYAYGEEVYPEKEWVWGCQIKGRAINGQCVMRKFTKVGEADNDVDTDEAQVLGFEPGNLPISNDGEPIYSRIKLERFLPPGQTRMFMATRCTCGQ